MEGALAPRPARPVPALARAGVAALAGLILGLAFPPFGVWPLLPVGVAAMTLACRGVSARIGSALGLLAGLAFFLVLLRWVSVIGVDAWMALALLEASAWLLLGAGLALVARLTAWPVWVAAVWVLVELVRARVPFGGFPWGRLAHALVESPALRVVALGGAPLLSFVGALAGALLAAGVVALGRRAPARAAGAVVAALVVMFAPLALPLPASAAGEEERVTVALVQGNVPELGMGFLGERRAVLNNHVAATRQLAAGVRAGAIPRPDLVIWPENASDLDPYADASARADIDAAVRAVGAPTLVGALVETPDGDRLENSGIVWDPRTGAGERYVKRHPVPFGEYIPFRDVVSTWIDRLDQIPRDFAPGQEVGVLRLGPATIGDVICFEVAYDDLVRDVVTGGAQLVVVQTNNATYGLTGQPEQQFAISRMRAVEHGRAVLVAATSGISGVIAADGAVLDRSAQFTRDVLVAEVPLGSERTLATRLGAWPEWALAIAAAAAMVLAARRRRTVQSRPRVVDGAGSRAEMAMAGRGGGGATR